MTSAQTEQTEAKMTSIQRYGEAGWAWTVTVTDEYGTSQVHYRTNRAGKGLWLYYGGAGEYRQQSGTSQFSLPRSEERARAKLAKQIASYRER